MIEIILLLVFIISAAGAGTILVRRMPDAQRIAAIPGAAEAVSLGQAAKKLCVAGIKKVPCFRDFNWLDFVQKMLMKGRVVVLKTENKINDYMTKLRQTAEVKREKEGEALDSYWHDLKTIIKTNSSIRHTETHTKPDEIANETAVKTKNSESVEIDVKAAIAQAQAQIESVQPAISRVAMPKDPQKTEFQSRKKKHNSKKRKFKDPFQW